MSSVHIIRKPKTTFNEYIMTVKYRYISLKIGNLFGIETNKWPLPTSQYRQLPTISKQMNSAIEKRRDISFVRVLTDAIKI